VKIAGPPGTKEQQGWRAVQLQDPASGMSTEMVMVVVVVYTAAPAVNLTQLGLKKQQHKLRCILKINYFFFI
jgi:hypothetical protein